MLSLALISWGLGNMVVKNGIDRERRRKEEENIKCEGTLLSEVYRYSPFEGSFSRLKEQIDNFQQVAECEKFVDNS